MAGPSLGINLSGIVDWGTSAPFVNLFQTSRAWFTQRDGVFNTEHAGLLDLDSNGYVRAFTQDGSVAPFTSVGTIWNTNPGYLRDGTYVLEWEGAGQLSVAGVPQGTILSQRQGRIELNLTDAQSVGFSISDPDGNSPGDYIRDIKLYHQDDADLIAAGVTFNPAFLEKMQDFRVFRFMDWGNTNNSDVTGWDEARPAAYVTQSSDGEGPGVSVALMVQLANEARADAWFTIPHLADDGYIRGLATYVRDHLAPGLVARFEYSNEVWNWGFQQAQWAQQQAEATWGSGVEGGWMQWYGAKAANMARIVADVFGAETGTRALNVFATQSAWQGLEGYALDSAESVADGAIAPRDAPFHVYAIAPYFGGEIGSIDMTAQVDSWIAQGEAGFAAAVDWIRTGPAQDSLANIDSMIAYHAGVAQGLGWQLDSYEGGQHVVDQAGLFGGAEDPARTGFFINLVARPEFGDLYAEYLQIWRDNGGGMLTHFSDFGPASRYGSWGIWNSVYAANGPRADAIEDFRDTVAAWWDDPRGAETFANGGLRVDYAGDGRVAGTALADRLFGLDGADMVQGRKGHDQLWGGTGADLLLGGAGRDRLAGGVGRDVLLGGTGADSLQGDAGTDVLSGGRGADRLDGGDGRDLFVFIFRADSPPAARDTITDFDRRADRIDLRIFDGNRDRDGDQRLVFVGADAFGADGTGEVRVILPGGIGEVGVQVDMNGDGRADLAIRILDLARLTASDFLL